MVDQYSGLVKLYQRVQRRTLMQIFSILTNHQKYVINILSIETVIESHRESVTCHYMTPSDIDGTSRGQIKVLCSIVLLCDSVSV